MHRKTISFREYLKILKENYILKNANRELKNALNIYSENHKLADKIIINKDMKIKDITKKLNKCKEELDNLKHDYTKQVYYANGFDIIIVIRSPDILKNMIKDSIRYSTSIKYDNKVYTKQNSFMMPECIDNGTLKNIISMLTETTLKEILDKMHMR